MNEHAAFTEGLNQVYDLIDMQKALDSEIFKKKDIKCYPLENMKIALFVELGELMNEMPTRFKHWKSTAQDNREKALVEYVDCLHFALSLAGQQMDDILLVEEYSLCQIRFENLSDLLLNIAGYLQDNSLILVLNELFYLGNALGFEWNEIYKAYMDKNAVNYERLKNGY